ncbi:MAG: type I DNA topoisomerase [Flavisolibacter sp.]
MPKNLLIVESPAKAKTIEKILGPDFEVRSCFGHIRDLEKDDMGIDIKNHFKPRYIVPEEKQKVVKDLKQMAKKSSEVWLATDEDREGEAISWHLCEVLGLDPSKTKRIVFHEITRPAIEKAVSNPRTVNMDLVNAQQARRILDRIVGFELSPVLWRKMSMKNNLSAGRVQSVAVRLIAEREREINAFKPQSSFRVEALFNAPDNTGRQITFKAEGSRFPKAENAENFLKECIGASYKVKDIQVKPTKRSPAAPFTTSTLQQEASRKMGYGVSRTMLLAQKLYENGHITYMRTDSVSLSETAMTDIRNTVTQSFGPKFYQSRKFKNKNESAQEAHEAIRPTYMSNSTVNDPDLKRLYELIWKRTMASQMADAELERTIARINVSTNNAELTAEGEVMKFEGFMKVYREDVDDEDVAEGDETKEGMLPPLKAGQQLAFREMKAIERFTRPLPRYTEASLVKKLEELGIGRPSTYAPTISTILKRGYVEKRDKEGVQRSYIVFVLNKDEVTKKSETENTGAEKSKLFPTDLGLVVTDFLKQYFDDIMDYGFTARIEEEFDEVAQGKMRWSKMLDDFYNPFKKDVEKTIETAERIKGERELGKNEYGKPVVARMGRYGPMVQIGRTEDEEKPKFARLKQNQSIETISYEEAMDLFKLPLALGTYEGNEVSVNVGRFGPYVKFGEQFISIPKGIEPLDLDLEKAVALIEEKKRVDAPIAEYKGQPVTKGKGRFGPFIKYADLFINVPRAYNFDSLSQKDIEELIEKKLAKEANRYIQNWPSEKISIENGRWGPFIKFGKKMLKLGRKEEGEKFTSEELANLSLEDVKGMIEKQVPGAFSKKASKKAATKKAGTKKTATKKGAVKKGSSKSSGKK